MSEEQLFMCRSCGAQSSTGDEAFSKDPCCSHSQWYAMHPAFRRDEAGEVLHKAVRAAHKTGASNPYPMACATLAADVVKLRVALKWYREHLSVCLTPAVEEGAVMTGRRFKETTL